MTREKRQKLRDLAVKAMRGPGPWQLQTSNSFRRIGQYGDGDVLCAVTQRPDGQPDLRGAPGVLDYIVEAQPCTIIVLLDYIEELERGAANSLAHQNTDAHRLEALIQARSRIDDVIRSFRLEGNIP